MSMKHAWLVFLVALVVVLPVRLYQLFALMEEDTGFLNGGTATTAVLVVVLLLAFAAIVVISKGSKRMPARYTPLRSIPTAVLSGLTGALLLVNSVSNIFIYSVQINGTAPSGESTTPAGVIGLAMAIVGILAAFAIFLAAYGFATGTNPVGEHPLVALLPAVWGCICLVLLFISYTAVVNVSENVYDMFAVVLLLLFLFAQAKFFTGMEGEKSGRMLAATGLPAALLALLTSVPTLLMAVLGRTVPGLFPAGLHLVNLCMACYILSFLFVARKLPAGVSAAIRTPEEEN